MTRGSRCLPPAKKAHHLCHFVYVHLRLSGMTMQEYAAKTGYSVSAIAQIWSGRRSGGIDIYESMLAVFGFGIKPCGLAAVGEAKQSQNETSQEPAGAGAGMVGRAKRGGRGRPRLQKDK
jgi:transcriptional regulator with XRE-family HTH domain